jgi:AcrR family transcriptional regulator
MTAACPYHHGNLRAALLDAAECSVEEQGAEQLSLRELARAVGVSHAAPRSHFPDRQALLDALAERGFDRLAAAMRGRHGVRIGIRRAPAGRRGRIRRLRQPQSRVARPDEHREVSRRCDGISDRDGRLVLRHPRTDRRRHRRRRARARRSRALRVPAVLLDARHRGPRHQRRPRSRSRRRAHLGYRHDLRPQLRGSVTQRSAIEAAQSNNVQSAERTTSSRPRCSTPASARVAYRMTVIDRDRRLPRGGSGWLWHPSGRVIRRGSAVSG